MKLSIQAQFWRIPRDSGGFQGFAAQLWKIWNPAAIGTNCIQSKYFASSRHRHLQSRHNNVQLKWYCCSKKDCDILGDLNQDRLNCKDIQTIVMKTVGLCKNRQRVDGPHVLLPHMRKQSVYFCCNATNQRHNPHQL